MNKGLYEAMEDKLRTTEGFNLLGFAKAVALGGVMEGLGSAAFYGVGKGLESLWRSVKGSKRGTDLEIADTKPSINLGKEPFRNANFKKSDIKMVNNAANQIGIDRREFGNYIHEIKAYFGMKANQNFTYQDLLQLAEEYKKMIE